MLHGSRGLTITDVRIRRLDARNSILKAYATIELNGALVVRGLKVVEGNRGLFVTMPARRRADGGSDDLVHPLDYATRLAIEKAILAAYRGEDPGPERAPVGARIPPPPSVLTAALARELRWDAA